VTSPTLLAWSEWPEQVPAVAHAIEEDGHASIGLRPWLLNDGYPGRAKILADLIEVIDPKEETYPPTNLIPEDRHLLWTLGTGEDDARLSTGGVNRPGFRRDSATLIYAAEACI
jgi:hypothetical protein